MSYIFSLSEIDALSKKATKGAGFEWGEAEEVAKTVKCLASYNYNVIPQLHTLFTTQKEQGEKIVRTICHLNDYRFLLNKQKLTYKAIDFPILLLPTLLNMVLVIRSAISVNADGIKAYIDSNGMYLDTGFDQLVHAKNIKIQKDQQQYTLQYPTPTGVSVERKDWQAMAILAEQYFAPSTEESRQNAGE